MKQLLSVMEIVAVVAAAAAVVVVVVLVVDAVIEEGFVLQALVFALVQCLAMNKQKGRKRG